MVIIIIIGNHDTITINRSEENAVVVSFFLRVDRIDRFLIKTDFALIVVQRDDIGLGILVKLYSTQFYTNICESHHFRSASPVFQRFC